MYGPLARRQPQTLTMDERSDEIARLKREMATLRERTFSYSTPPAGPSRAQPHWKPPHPYFGRKWSQTNWIAARACSDHR